MTDDSFSLTTHSLQVGCGSLPNASSELVTVILDAHSALWQRQLCGSTAVVLADSWLASWPPTGTWLTDCNWHIHDRWIWCNESVRWCLQATFIQWLAQRRRRCRSMETSKLCAAAAAATIVMCTSTVHMQDAASVNLFSLRPATTNQQVVRHAIGGPSMKFIHNSKWPPMLKCDGAALYARHFHSYLSLVTFLFAWPVRPECSVNCMRWLTYLFNRLTVQHITRRTSLRHFTTIHKTASAKRFHGRLKVTAISTLRPIAPLPFLNIVTAELTF